jgi:hypothetical protein
MKGFDAAAPVSILLAHQLSPAARLVLFALHADANLETYVQSTRRLSLRTGLSKYAVRYALHKLVSSGWYADPNKEKSRTAVRPLPHPRVVLPGDLLADTAIPPYAKVVYGLLISSPGYEHPKGTFTFASLSSQLQVSTDAVISAVSELEKSGWVVLDEGQPQDEPIAFSVCTPDVHFDMTELEHVKRRLSATQINGKSLMWEYLTLIVDSVEFCDDSGMSFLLNPFDGELMTLNRYYYNHKVAFEFRTPRPRSREVYITDNWITKEEAYLFLKRGMCELKGVPLIEIELQDLNVESMQKKVGDLLPQRDLKDRGPVIKYLETKTRSYLALHEVHLRKKRKQEGEA